MQHTNETMLAEIDKAKALKLKTLASLDAEINGTKKRFLALEAERERVKNSSHWDVLESDALSQSETKYWLDAEDEEVRKNNEKRMDKLHAARRFGAHRVFKLVLAGTLPLVFIAGFADAYPVSSFDVALACAFYYSMLCFIGTMQP